MGTHYTGTPGEVSALNVYIKLSRAAEAVEAVINQHLKDHHLTTSQFGVLEALYHLGPMTTGQLGEKILKSSGNMTLVIDNLEKQGLANRLRQTDDRRCIEVHLTHVGHSLVESIFPQHVQCVLSAFSVLTSDEQDQLAALCRKLGLAQG